MTLDADTDRARRGIDETRVLAERFGSLRVAAQLDADTGKADAKIEAVRKLAAGAARERPTIILDADTRKATTAITGALAVAKAAEKDAIRIKLDADKVLLDRKLAEAEAELAKVKQFGGDIVLDAEIGPFMAKAGRLQAQIDKWQTQRSSVEIDANIAKAEAEITRLYEHVQLVSERDYTLEVTALTAEAEAKLAAVTAQAAALDRKRIQLDVDAGGTEQAAQGMSRVAMYAGIAAAAFPAVGAAIVALPGLLAAAVVPAVALAAGADGIGAAVKRISPQLIELRARVADTFEHGLAPAIANVSGLLPTLESGLSGTATSLSGLATNVTAVVTSSTSMRGILDQVNRLIAGMSPGISGLVVNLLNLAEQGLAGLQPLGAVFTQLSAEWAEVIATLQRTGQGQAAVAALIQVLGGLLELLPPLVQLGAELMVAVGPPLAAALHAVSAVLGPIATLFGDLPAPIQTTIAAVAAFRIAMSLLGNSGSTATRALDSTTQSTSRLGQAFNTAMTPVRSIGSAFTEMGTAYRGATAGLDEGSSRLQRFGSIAGGVATAGATGFKVAATGLLGALGGPWGLAISAATIGLGLLGQHMADNAQKAQTLAQASQDFANSLSRTGGVLTSNTTAMVAQQAAQAGLLQTTDKLGISSQTVTTAITQQGPALAALRTQLQGVIDAGTTYGTTMDGDVTISTSDAAKAAQDALGKLNDLAGAFTNGQAAAKALGDAMGSLGSHFVEGAAAADQATRTTALFAQGMQQLGDNSLSASDKVKGLAGAFESAADPARTFLQAQLQASEAIDKFGSGLGKIPPAVVSLTGAISTTSKAGRALATDVLGAAKAYDDLYGATIQNALAQGDQMPQAIAKAAHATAGYREQLIAQMIQLGLTREAATAVANTYLKVPTDVKTQISTPGMLEAVLGSMGLKDKIEQIPGHKGIIVDSNSTALIVELEALGYKVTKLPNGKIQIDMDTSPADTKLAGFKASASAKIDIPVGANTDSAMHSVGVAHATAQQAQSFVTGSNTGPAGAAVSGVHAQARVAQSFNTGSNTGPAKGAVDVVHGQARVAQSFNTGSNTGPAKGAVDAVHAQARVGQSFNTDSNTGPARGQVSSVQSFARIAQSFVVSIIDGATPSLRDIYNTWGHRVLTWTVNLLHGIGFAGGGVHTPDEAFGHHLTSMTAGRAAIVPPNTWRIIGDRTSDDEFYIPDNNAAMSLALGAEWAHRRGLALTPMNQVTSRMSPAAGTHRPAAPLVVRGSDGAAAGEVVAALRDLRRDMQQIKQGRGDVTINAPTYNPTAEPSSDSQARALRTGAELARLALR